MSRAALLAVVFMLLPMLGVAGEAEWKSAMRIGRIAFEGLDHAYAETNFREALREIGSFKASHRQLAETLHWLGHTLVVRGGYRDAEAVFRRALAVVEENAKAVGSTVRSDAHNGLALAYAKQGRYDAAVPLYKRAIQIQEDSQAVARDFPSMATYLLNLGEVYEAQSDHIGAQALYERSLEILQDFYGREHWQLIAPLRRLATLHEIQRKDSEAERHYKRALQIGEGEYGATDMRLVSDLEGLARLYERTGRTSEAKAFNERVTRIARQVRQPSRQ